MPEHYRFRTLQALLLVGTLLSVSACDAQDANNNRLPSGLAYYQNYCANCHGKSMDGGNGGGLRTQADFQHGFEPDAVFKSIKNGIPNLGMPAYGATLTDEQIKQIVDVIKNPAVSEASTSVTRTQAIRERTKLRTLDYEVK